MPSEDREKIRKTRLTAASSGMAVPVAATKMAKVGVAPEPMNVTRVGPTAEMQVPATGSVWHRLMFTGRATPPVLADTVMVSPRPTLATATAKAPVLVSPGMWTIPSLDAVTGSATVSAGGVADGRSSSVLMPVNVGAGGVFVPANTKATSTGPTGEVGVIEIT